MTDVDYVRQLFRVRRSAAVEHLTDLRFTRDGVDVVTATFTASDVRNAPDDIDSSLVWDLQSQLDNSERAIGEALHLPSIRAGSKDDEVFHRAWERLTGRSNAAARDSEVTVDVGPAIAAAASRPARLRSLAETTLIDFRHDRRRPPGLGAGVTFALDGATLTLSSDGSARVDVEEVAVGLLSRQRSIGRPARYIDAWVPRSVRFWSAGSLAMVAAGVAVSVAPLGAVAIATLAAATAVVVGITLVAARRAGARVGPTALGLAAPAVVLAFAVVYAAAMAGASPTISAASSPSRMVDPLLLSVAIASTGGFLDYVIDSSTMRIAALVEMLLVVGVAGGSAYTLVRGAWRRVEHTLSTRQEG